MAELRSNPWRLDLLRTRWARRRCAWILAAALFGGLGLSFASGSRGLFLPGATSDGHHLIEASCNSCHSPFRGEPTERCASCHRPELAQDIHPARLFDDPRWASDLERLDARDCVTCHREHRIADRGVTIEPSFCIHCHEAVLTERATHREFTPEGCASDGCHNYHDGSALRADRLLARLGEPRLLPGWGVATRSPRAAPGAGARDPDPDPPPGLPVPARVLEDWRRSAHAFEASCSSCHLADEGVTLRPGRSVCQECHGFEAETFLAGKHGMRLGVGLEALHPRDARLPMKPRARNGDSRLDCSTCHDPHSVDTRRAALEACLGCHDDRHSRAFRESPHARTVGDPAAGSPPRPREVLCATCHLPRVEVEGEDGPRIAVHHNNSLTLSPPDRMATMVCDACHGFEFALSALLDEALVTDNFETSPRGRPKTFTMVERLANQKQKRRNS